MPPAGVRFSITEAVHASNDAIWAVLGDFGTEHRWTRTLAHCERDTSDVRVGTARTCTLPRPLMGRARVREELIEYEPGAALAYDLDGPAGPFLTASSRWATRADTGSGTALTVEGRFTPRNWFVRLLVWPLARLAIRRLTRKVIRELEAYVLARGAAKALPAGPTSA
jgi:hypothetical protein